MNLTNRDFNLCLYIRLMMLVIVFAFFSLPVCAEEPVKVKIGLKVDQITNIDQKQENFSAVATFLMEWNQPDLAVEPGDSATDTKMYRVDSFIRLMEQRELIWPEVNLQNIQGRIDYQSQTVIVEPTGDVFYIARFTGTFQAPDFDFKQFPLDHQRFYITVDSLLPEDIVIFEPMVDFDGLGDTLGEEEWILTNARSEVVTHSELKVPASRYVMSFEGQRHLNYYIVRILLPVLIIILVSWITFFLKDYTKRIEMASGNLLLFIAFNFTIAQDLPRLGYLTLMDTFMLSIFAITSLVVLANVIYRRLEFIDKANIVCTLDNIGVYIYPLLYVVAWLCMYMFFLD